MQDFLSQRARTIKPSVTLSISAKAKAMRAEGIDVLNFSVGEPDFDTPENIKQAAREAMDQGFTKYTAAGGIPELKQAIADKYQREQNLEFPASRILVSNGGKHAIHNMFQAMLDPGDEVIIPAPYWLSYPDLVELSGGVPVVVNTTLADGFKISPAQLEEAITQRTKILILNSPSNPTGAVYSADELRALGQVIEKSGIMVMSDDVYEKFVFDGGSFVNLAMAMPALADRSIIINSVSKTYSMPGWRIGWAIAPEPIIAAAGRIQGQATSCAGSIAQKAVVYALGSGEETINAFRASFEKRRNLMVEGLAKIEGVRALNPSGAFYVFADVSALYAKAGVNNSVDFCSYLLDKPRIAVIPGQAFGDDACIRFSFVAAEGAIREGMARLAEI